MWVCSNCGTRNDDCSCVCIRCREKRATNADSLAEDPSLGKIGRVGRRNILLFISSTFLILLSVVMIVFSLRPTAQTSFEQKPAEPEQADTEARTSFPSSEKVSGIFEILEGFVEESPSEQPLSAQQVAELDDLVSRCTMFMLQTDWSISNSSAAVFCLDIDGDGQDDWLMQDGAAIRVLLNGEKGGIFLSKGPIDIRNSRRLEKPVLHVIVGSGTGYMDSYKVFNGDSLEELAYSDEQLLLDELGSSNGATYMIERAYANNAEYEAYLDGLQLESSIQPIDNRSFLERTMDIRPEQLNLAALYMEQKPYLSRQKSVDLDGDGLNEEIFLASADRTPPADIRILEPEYGNYLGEKAEWQPRVIVLSVSGEQITSSLYTTDVLNTAPPAETSAPQPEVSLSDGQYFVKLGRDQILETGEGYSLEIDLKAPVSFSIPYVQGLQAGDTLDLRAFHSEELGDECPISEIQRISWYREDDYTINPEADYPGLILTLDEDSQQYILMDPHSDYVFYYSPGWGPVPMTEGTVVRDSYTSIMTGTEGEITGGPEVLFAFFDQWGPEGENIYITVEGGTVTEIEIPYSP